MPGEEVGTVSKLSVNTANKQRWQNAIKPYVMLSFCSSSSSSSRLHQRYDTAADSSRV